MTHLLLEHLLGDVPNLLRRRQAGPHRQPVPHLQGTTRSAMARLTATLCIRLVLGTASGRGKSVSAGAALQPQALGCSPSPPPDGTSVRQPPRRAARAGCPHMHPTARIYPTLPHTSVRLPPAASCTCRLHTHPPPQLRQRSSARLPNAEAQRSSAHPPNPPAHLCEAAVCRGLHVPAAHKLLHERRLDEGEGELPLRGVLMHVELGDKRAAAAGGEEFLQKRTKTWNEHCHTPLARR